MLAVIGSKALSFHIDLGQRVLNDLDLVGPYHEVMAFAHSRSGMIECYPIANGNKYVIKYSDKSIIEAEIAWEGSSAEQLWALAYHSSSDRIRINGTMLAIPSLDVLYMLKMSHRYLKNSPHFLKTMRDIQLMRQHGAIIQSCDVEFYKSRMKETYDYGHPNLGVNKDAFFTGDGVQYVYDHDTIHLAMAHLDQPAYKYYQPKDSEVNVSKALFFAQPEEIRLYGVLEEAYVLALERSQIPYPDTDPKKSFDIALMKVCTSITSGWFREYAWESYDQVQDLYTYRYVENFWIAVEHGIVKPYKGD